MAKQKDQPKKVSFLESPEIKAQLKAYEQARDAFEKQLDAFCQRAGMSFQEMKNYVENPNNFSPYKWEVLQKEKARLEKIREELDKRRTANRATNFGTTTTTTETKKPRKKLGVRQNWIPM